jgi:uncharacterized RDD family membrane protein YckC
MQDPNNPYAAPQQASYRVVRPNADLNMLMDASTGARFVNIFVDTIMRTVFNIGVQTALTMALGQVNTGLNIFVWLLTNPGYYVLFETWLGRTPGKYLSRTRVVMADGSDPTLHAIVIRTLCRLVPFEVFSIFGSSSMWHDRWSGTRVVAVV